MIWYYGVQNTRQLAFTFKISINSNGVIQCLPGHSDLIGPGGAGNVFCTALHGLAPVQHGRARRLGIHLGFCVEKTRNVVGCTVQIRTNSTHS